MRVFIGLSWISLALAQSSSSVSSSSSSSSSSISLNSTSSSSSSSISSSSSSSSSLSSSSASSRSSSSSSSLLGTTSASSISSLSTSASASAALNGPLALPTSNGTVSNTTAPTPTGPVSYVNPWAGNFSQPVPQHGTGSNYALQCQNAYYSFTSVNSDFLTATASLFNYTSVIRSTTVYEVHTYYTTSYYTLCDGHPRIITSMPTATSTTTLPPSTTVILAQGVSWASLNDPNCTVSWDDCANLWSTYYSASSVYESVSFAEANTVVSLGPGGSFWQVDGVTTTFPTPNPMTISLGDEYIHKDFGGKTTNYLIVTTPPPGGLFLDAGYTMTPGGDPVTITHVIDFTNTPYTPHCRTEKPTCTAGSRCQIGGDRVEIFYFPATTNATRDMCATAPLGNGVTSRPPTNFTWTPITTGPYTVTNGQTWYSGNVYVSLNRISAECNWSGTSVEVGDEHGGQILTMAPSELFSQRAFPITTGSFSGGFDFSSYAYSFNFADLISPYPWSAWDGTPDCVMDRCTVINETEGLNPWIAVPEAIRRLDKSWATCDLALYGLYDPPRALSSVGNIFASLTSKDPVVTATPGQSPPQSVVEPTSPPSQPTQPSDPSDPSDPPSNSGTPNDPPQQSQAPGNPSNPSNPNNPNNPNTPANSGTPNNPNNPTNPGQTNGPNPPAQPGVTPNPIPPAPTTIGTVGNTPIVINPANPTSVIVGSSTLAPGGPGITVGQGTSVSMADPGHIIISAPGNPAPSTINVPQPADPQPTAGAVITLPNGDTVTATAITGPSGSSIIVSGTMLTPGGAPVTLPNGVVISEAPSGTGIVVISDGQTSTLGFSSVPGIGTPAQPTSGAVITLPNGQVVTATAIPGPHGSSVILGPGTTLSEGGPAITLPNGVVLSEAPSGTGIIVIDPATGATSTIPFSSVSGLVPNTAVATPHPTEGAVVTIGGQVYTVIDENGSVIIPALGITLTEGGPASTINGTIISDAGTGIVVGTTTQPFSTVTVTDPTSTGGGDFTGGAGSLWQRKDWSWANAWLVGMVMIGSAIVVL